MVYIRRIIRHKYVLKSDIQIKDSNRKTFEISPMPLPLIDKFMYHLPFYRLIQKYRESGVVFNDSTTNGWFSATCERLKPLYDLLKSEILRSEYIQVDESTVSVINNEKHRTIKGYMWCVRDALHGLVYSHYDLGSRSKAITQHLLFGYQGSIQTDIMYMMILPYELQLSIL